MNITNLKELDNKWNNLKLSEKLFCLAIDARKVGFQIPCYSPLAKAINVAIIIELIENKSIVIQDDLNIHFKTVPVYDRVHHFCMEFIRGHKQITELKKLYNMLCLKYVDIQHLIRRDLVRKNIINVKKKSYLIWVKRRYSFHKQSIIQNITAEILSILSSSQAPNNESFILVFLASKMELISDDTIGRNIRLYLENISPENVPSDARIVMQLIK